MVNTKIISLPLLYHHHLLSLFLSHYPKYSYASISNPNSPISFQTPDTHRILFAYPQPNLISHSFSSLCFVSPGLLPLFSPKLFAFSHYGDSAARHAQIHKDFRHC